jgi:16S rRNA (adenine1518-N6/adenine1519-N6)-dimethyltransferase
MSDAGTAARAPRRKRFGQHFLHDPAVIGRIVQSLGVQPGDRLVEIGPGRGALTARLLTYGDCTLDAIEIDRDLARALLALFTPPRSVLHVVDALQFDFGRLAVERGGPLRIVGNLPYNISTPLLFHLLRNPGALTDMTIMLQREVVARMAAGAGSADYGRLSVMLAPLAEIRPLFDIGPGAFQPPPRVWSAVVRLTLRPAPLFPLSPTYAAVVAAAFAHRRKTLRNALSQMLTRTQIEACGIDSGARPETLTPAAFNTLATALDRARADS